MNRNRSFTFMSRIGVAIEIFSLRSMAARLSARRMAGGPAAPTAAAHVQLFDFPAGPKPESEIASGPAFRGFDDTRLASEWTPPSWA